MIRLTLKGYGQTNEFDTGVPDVGQSLPSDMMLRQPAQTVSIRAQAMSQAMKIQQQAGDEVLFSTGLTGEYAPAGDEEQSPAPPLLTPETESPQTNLGAKKTKWWPWALGVGGLVVAGIVTAVVLSRRKRRK